MKLLKEKGFIPKKKVRLIVGTDEESDWKCLNYYQSICPIPKIGFVPDAYFPIVNGEKEMVVWSLSGSVKKMKKLQ
ncbi:hypothetical protein ACR31S_05825 [Streptococcus iniae]